MMSTGDQTRQIATGKSALELRRTAVFFSDSTWHRDRNRLQR